jgi:hypothetical protein
MIIGFILGILSCTFLLILDIWGHLETKRRKRLQDLIRPNKGEVLMPKSQQERSVLKIIEENEKKGRDTLIEEIFK